MSSQQTDNDADGFSYKVSLRLESVKKDVTVLDCFSGHGTVWSGVKEYSTKKIKTLQIDTRSDKSGVYLKGNNIKFLKTIDLSKFDIVDLDAYGVPFPQLEILFDRKYKGIIHCTFIQSNQGRLNHMLLNELGYSNEMIKKCPTLFSKNGFEKFCKYLRKRGISKINFLSLKNKHYLYFKT